jgi:hypothetical protein
METAWRKGIETVEEAGRTGNNRAGTVQSSGKIGSPIRAGTPSKVPINAAEAAMLAEREEYTRFNAQMGIAEVHEKPTMYVHYKNRATTPYIPDPRFEKTHQ